MSKVAMFDDYSVSGDARPAEERMNDFIADKAVVDVKMNTVLAANAAFFTRYLVIYEESPKEDAE